MKSLRWLTLGFLAAGCAGQLDLPPEAYGSGLTAAGGADGAASMPGSQITPLWPPDAGVPVPEVGEPSGSPPPAMPPPAVPDAGAPTEVGVVADAGPAPAPASACPAGVEPLQLIIDKCGNCHGTRSPAKAFDVVSPGLADRLLTIKSTCQNRPQLDVATNPAAPGGHFIDKLRGPVAGCGAQMPYGTPPLTGPELDCLIEWSGRAIARAQKGQ
jgi:hypothetical protein